MHNSSSKPFPIPVVAAVGPGSQAEDETLDYITMPQGMDAYQAPSLPEPEELHAHTGAVQVLQRVLLALGEVVQSAAVQPGAGQRVDVGPLSAGDMALVGQVLGEGEVSAQVLAPDGSASVTIQESVFAGVWRVLERLVDGAVRDYVEVGPIPKVLLDAAQADGALPVRAAEPVPVQAMNAPTILVELEDQRRRWRAGQPAHVVNLSLLPMGPDDIGYMDHRLGTGRVLILSRGYGNCRITNCNVPNTWRVVYYNSADTVILNSVEVVDVPEVGCAAAEDLRDSHERLHEVLQWVAQA